MNAKSRVFTFLVLAFFLLGGLLMTTATKVAADPPPDILDAFAITVFPQTDGMLNMTYLLKNYCTKSDWPSDQPYLQIGIPNENFTLVENSILAKGVAFTKPETIKEIGATFVQLDFDEAKLPKKDDCFDLGFSIVQGKMAFPDPQDATHVTFKYIPPSWDFDIQVKKLIVTWALPADPSLVKLADPKPVMDAMNMTWSWDNPSKDSNNMYDVATIKLAYDKSAFTLSDAATTDTEPYTLSLSGFWGSTCCWVIFWILLVILVIWILAAWARSADSGDGFGTSFVGVAGDFADAVVEAGGSGGSSGGSSGCASGCACACACAGGGKVGCMLKYIGIKMGCLQKVIEEMIKPVPDEKKE